MSTAGDIGLFVGGALAGAVVGGAVLVHVLRRTEAQGYKYILLYQDGLNTTRSAGVIFVPQGADSTRIIESRLERARADFKRQGLRASTLRVVPVDD